MSNDKGHSTAVLSRAPMTLFAVHEKEKALLEFLRKLQHGTVHRLVVQDGLPVLIEETHPTHRL